MSIDDLIGTLSSDEIKSMEAEIKERRNRVDPVYLHHGSVEDLSADEIRSMEAEIKERRNRIDPVYIHHGSIEDADASTLKIMEAHVAEQRKIDLPYKEYFNNLIVNPVITDNQQFEDAVIRSMQSNRVMREFTSRLVEKISEVTYGFRNITDEANINIQKQKLENLVNLYVRYAYELKKHGWIFNGPGAELEKINVDAIWNVQKEFDMIFTTLIPADLGKYYGQAFEREGKMVPAIRLMYDNLNGKEVNWHQVLIYKENELTPKQRYLKSREEAVKQFDLSRQEEIKNVVALAHEQEKNNMVANIENQEPSDTTSMRR